MSAEPTETIQTVDTRCEAVKIKEENYKEKIISTSSDVKDWEGTKVKDEASEENNAASSHVKTGSVESKETGKEGTVNDDCEFEGDPPSEFFDDFFKDDFLENLDVVDSWNPDEDETDKGKEKEGGDGIKSRMKNDKQGEIRDEKRNVERDYKRDRERRERSPTRRDKEASGRRVVIRPYIRGRRDREHDFHRERPVRDGKRDRDRRYQRSNRVYEGNLKDEKLSTYKMNDRAKTENVAYPIPIAYRKSQNLNNKIDDESAPAAEKKYVPLDELVPPGTEDEFFFTCSANPVEVESGCLHEESHITIDTSTLKSTSDKVHTKDRSMTELVDDDVILLEGSEERIVKYDGRSRSVSPRGKAEDRTKFDDGTNKTKGEDNIINKEIQSNEKHVGVTRRTRPESEKNLKSGEERVRSQSNSRGQRLVSLRWTRWDTEANDKNHDSRRKSVDKLRKMSVDRDVRKSLDRSPKRSLDRGRRRSKERSPRRSLKLGPKRSMDHSPRRTLKLGPRRTLKLGPRRSVDRSPRRSVDRSPRRSVDRSPRRSLNRVPRRSVDRSPRRSLNEGPRRSVDRSARRSLNEGPRRSVDRSARRSVDRSARRSVDRSARRSLNQGSRRSVDRSSRRSVDRNARRSVDRGARRSVDRSPRRSLDKSSRRWSFTKGKKSLDVERSAVQEFTFYDKHVDEWRSDSSFKDKRRSTEMSPVAYERFSSPSLSFELSPVSSDRECVRSLSRSSSSLYLSSESEYTRKRKLRKRSPFLKELERKLTGDSLVNPFMPPSSFTSPVNPVVVMQPPAFPQQNQFQVPVPYPITIGGCYVPVHRPPPPYCVPQQAVAETQRAPVTPPPPVISETKLHPEEKKLCLSSLLEASVKVGIAAAPSKPEVVVQRCEEAIDILKADENLVTGGCFVLNPLKKQKQEPSIGSVPRSPLFQSKNVTFRFTKVPEPKKQTVMSKRKIVASSSAVPKPAPCQLCKQCSRKTFVESSMQTNPVFLSSVSTQVGPDDQEMIATGRFVSGPNIFHGNKMPMSNFNSDNSYYKTVSYRASTGPEGPPFQFPSAMLSSDTSKGILKQYFPEKPVCAPSQQPFQSSQTRDIWSRLGPSPLPEEASAPPRFGGSAPSVPRSAGDLLDPSIGLGGVPIPVGMNREQYQVFFDRLPNQQPPASMASQNQFH